MMRVVLAVLIAFMLVATASAYDPMYSYRNAGTAPAGSFGLAGRWVYLAATDYYDDEGNKEKMEGFGYEEKDTWQSITFDAYYATMDQWTAGVFIPYTFLTYNYTDARDDSEDASGIGDIWLYTKYRFTDAPMWTGQFGWKINTGAAPVYWGPSGWLWYDEDDNPAIGSGQMDLDLSLWFGLPSESGRFDAALGYRYRMEGELDAMVSRQEKIKYDPGDEIHYYLNYVYFLNEAWSLGLASDGYFGQDDKLAGETWDDPTTARNAVYLDPYVGHNMMNGWSLGAGFHYPIMGQNIHASWGFDAYVGWNW
jgi:hypothetical protein